MSLALDTGGRDAFDEGLLGEEEYDDDRQGDERACGHQVMPFRALALALE